MKKYLVKLNHPVYINDSDRGEPILCPVYGFLSPYSDVDEELNHYYRVMSHYYVGYLAAMHEWSAGRENSFSVETKEHKHWRDRDGNVHASHDSWMNEICERNREQLGLDYTLYTIDLYGSQGCCPGCGRDGSLIICETVMNKLVEIAEQPQVRPTEPRTIILFNRPIWLSAEIIWERPGFCHIYGIIEDKRIDDTVKSNANTYLGYLAMCEEFYLSGITPSGFSTKDGVVWYKGGREYLALEDAIKEEGRICMDKHNLTLYAAELQIPHYDAREGVIDGLIVNQSLYEHLLEGVRNR